MQIGILGAGSWGMAIAKLLSENGHVVTVWSIDPEELAMLKEFHEHKTKLPGVILPKEINYTGNLEAVAKSSDALVMVVPSPFVRSTAKSVAPHVREGQLIINCAKGIEEDTLYTLDQVIAEEIPGARIGVLSGPSHAEEVGRAIPTTVVAGAKNHATAELIQDIFMNDYFRVYTSEDMVGIEIGAALKNVIALAAGIADGMGCGDNTKAALITRGIAEITRLGIRMGCRMETFLGLSGIGDLIVTCESKHSRNRRAGFLMGQGMTYREAMDEVQMVVEGVYSAKAAKALSARFGVEMPIVDTVNRVLFEDLKAKDAIGILLKREKTAESYGYEGV